MSSLDKCLELSAQACALSSSEAKKSLEFNSTMTPEKRRLVGLTAEHMRSATVQIESYRRALCGLDSQGND